MSLYNRIKQLLVDNDEDFCLALNIFHAHGLTFSNKEKAWCLLKDDSSLATFAMLMCQKLKYRELGFHERFTLGKFFYIVNAFNHDFFVKPLGYEDNINEFLNYIKLHLDTDYAYKLRVKYPKAFQNFESYEISKRNTLYKELGYQNVPVVYDMCAKYLSYYLGALQERLKVTLIARTKIRQIRVFRVTCKQAEHINFVERTILARNEEEAKTTYLQGLMLEALDHFFIPLAYYSKSDIHK